MLIGGYCNVLCVDAGICDTGADVSAGSHKLTDVVNVGVNCCGGVGVGM